MGADDSPLARPHHPQQCTQLVSQASDIQHQESVTFVCDAVIIIIIIHAVGDAQHDS